VSKSGNIFRGIFLKMKMQKWETIFFSTAYEILFNLFNLNEVRQVIIVPTKKIWHNSIKFFKTF
jgi:hypothetical protein